MNLPRRYGKMYIKFDENNCPKYAFEVDGNRIKKFVPLTDEEIKTIVLPKLTENNRFDIASIDEKNSCQSTLFYQKTKMQEYITGSVKICSGCFADLKKTRIVVPFENSIMLDWDSFDSNAKVELVVPSNLTLKQIYRVFDNGFDYERENWTLLGDKKITKNFNIGSGFGMDKFSILEYNENDLDNKVANFTIKHFHLEEKSSAYGKEEELVK